MVTVGVRQRSGPGGGWVSRGAQEVAVWDAGCGLGDQGQLEKIIGLEIQF